MNDCRKIRLMLDEYAAGDLPDYERAAVARHLERCAECREEADAAIAIVGAARTTTLEMPGDAYFADLGLRLEEEGPIARLLEAAARPIVRRARLLNGAQRVAAAAAVLLVMAWSSVVVALVPGNRLENPNSTTTQIGMPLHESNVANSISELNRIGGNHDSLMERLGETYRAFVPTVSR